MDNVNDTPIPELSEINPDSYEEWRKKIISWTNITPIKNTKQALAVVLSLPNDIKKIALELDVDKLNTRNGMNYLLDELDFVFKKDDEIFIFEIYNDFETFKRPLKCSLPNYVSKFEFKYSRIKRLGIVLSDKLLAVELIKKANLNEEEEELVIKNSGVALYKSIKNELLIFKGKCTKEKNKDTTVSIAYCYRTELMYIFYKSVLNFFISISA